MIRKPRDHYPVGPGPLTMRSFLGDVTRDVVPHGLYAIAYDDEQGPRLLDGHLFWTRDDAQRAASWAGISD